MNTIVKNYYFFDELHGLIKNVCFLTMIILKIVKIINIFINNKMDLTIIRFALEGIRRSPDFWITSSIDLT
ncbi:MAG: hypothetical protein COA50_08080 [Flavobacteriaceae bacterium]|nr:MAG: hypothetical protein COA50_08080 [Flavobacteriaceae bacterium]